MIIFDISMSLDGFITAPSDRPGEELGDGDRRLHDWVLDTAGDLDRGVLEEMWSGAGAIVSGARTFDVCVAGWGGKPPADLPWLVLSHDKPERVANGGAGFTFVTDGVESTLEQAKAAAGDKYVLVMGGANVGRQCLQGGLLDEMQIHLVPVLFGGGIRLFDRLNFEQIKLETTRVIETPAATHLRFRVGKANADRFRAKSGLVVDQLKTGS